jgi:8-oxo-dGTP pyrophosphatase MutT (NUDIX family)
MESNTVNAVGIWFYSRSTKRYLYLLRQDFKHPDTWGLPGGKVEANESLLDAIKRECLEEIGYYPSDKKLYPIEKFTNPKNNFVYNTFVCILDQEFIPILNEEHKGYAWIDQDSWPRPMHPGLWSMVNIDAVKEKLGLVLDNIT